MQLRLSLHSSGQIKSVGFAILISVLSLNLPEALVQLWILIDTSGFGLASSHAGQGVPWLEAWCLLSYRWARNLSELTRDRASCLQKVECRTA